MCPKQCVAQHHREYHLGRAMPPAHGHLGRSREEHVIWSRLDTHERGQTVADRDPVCPQPGGPAIAVCERVDPDPFAVGVSAKPDNGGKRAWRYRHPPDRNRRIERQDRGRGRMDEGVERVRDVAGSDGVDGPDRNLVVDETWESSIAVPYVADVLEFRDGDAPKIRRCQSSAISSVGDGLAIASASIDVQRVLMLAMILGRSAG